MSTDYKALNRKEKKGDKRSLFYISTYIGMQDMREVQGHVCIDLHHGGTRLVRINWKILAAFGQIRLHRRRPRVSVCLLPPFLTVLRDGDFHEILFAIHECPKRKKKKGRGGKKGVTRPVWTSSKTKPTGQLE
jgi:hypothetical protein